MDILQLKEKVLLVIILLCFSFFFYSVQSDGTDTSIMIVPTSQIVRAGEIFQISVFCIPTEPIKSFIINIGFDETLLQANQVFQGSIFNGYQTFFQIGTIDNVNGQISSIYDVIMGPGNVNTPGYLVNISFTAKSITGTTQILLTNCGITNETMYLPISITNGSVTIDAIPPTCTDQSPNQGSTGDAFTVNVSITDNIDDGTDISARLDWSHGANGDNISMNRVGGSYFEKTITLDDNSLDDLIYSIYMQDSQGNTATTTAAQVTVVDNDNPLIGNLISSPSTQTLGGSVNITADITDNIDVNQIFLHITYPDATSTNISIVNNNIGTSYYYENNYNLIGSYSWFIWAEDTGGNTQISGMETFLITDNENPQILDILVRTSNPLDTEIRFGWVNFTCTVIDDELNHVKLILINPDETSSNITMDSTDDNNYYYNVTLEDYGKYSYYIWVNDISNNQNASVLSILSLSPNWDINQDGYTTVFDLILISNHFNETGEPGWIREDVDNNGLISLLDLLIVANHYTESW